MELKHAIQGKMSIGGERYSITCLQPGAYQDVISAEQHFLDIYLGGSIAAYRSENGEVQTAPCPPNSFSFIPARSEHRVETVRSGTTVRFQIDNTAVTDPAICQLLAEVRHPLWNYFDAPMIGAGWIVHDFLTVSAENDMTAPPDFLRDLLISRIAQIILKRGAPQSVQHPPAIQKAIEYIETHLTSPLHLNEIADVAGVSDYHFARQFRQIMNMSLRRYVQWRRVDNAQRLIRHTDQSLADISYQSGFGSQSHMTTVFRQLTKQTPGEHRKASQSA